MTRLLQWSKQAQGGLLEHRRSRQFQDLFLRQSQDLLRWDMKQARMDSMVWARTNIQMKLPFTDGKC